MSEHLVRSAYEAAFAGKPEEFRALLSDDYVHYAADTTGAYREFGSAEYTKILAGAAVRTESSSEVLESRAIGNEIVFVVVSVTRRDKESGRTATYRVADLVNLVNGKIVRIVEIAEQAAFEFWRAIDRAT